MVIFPLKHLIFICTLFYSEMLDKNSQTHQFKLNMPGPRTRSHFKEHYVVLEKKFNSRIFYNIKCEVVIRWDSLMENGTEINSHMKPSFVD